MGINVYQNKAVTIDHSHQRLVDTSLDGNPTQGEIEDILLTFIFRRRSIRDHRGTPPTYGDGNPLVYALKQMNGYTIQPMYRQMLFNRGKEILQVIPSQPEGSVLLDVPSSKPLCREFLKHVGEALELPILESSLLRKRTVSEVLSDFDHGLPKLKKRDAAALKKELGALRGANPEEVFQMKLVRNTKSRKFFLPFTVEGDPSEIEGKEIILVDDLVATGSSIVSVAQCLRVHGATVRHGISLLSALDARQPREHT